MSDFDVAVRAWVERSKTRTDTTLRAFGEALTTRVKELTPVVTGFLRANWVAVLSVEALPAPKSNQSQGDEIARAKVGADILILNAATYARRVEYGFTGTDALGRTYNQPARGMVAQTIAEAPKILDQVVERLNRS